MQLGATAPRQGVQAAAPLRALLPSRRRGSRATAPPPRTLPDGAATSEAPLQQEAVMGAPPQPPPQQQLEGWNNAVQRQPRGGRAPLPEHVEWLLSSPTLERPEGTDPKQLLHVMEAFWSAQKAAFADPSSAPQPPAVVRRVPGSCGAASEFDAVVAGGTLGVLLALALQQRGHRVAIVERRVLEGRMQEWNIGHSELQQLVACGLLSAAEVESCVVSRWDSVRVSFHGGAPLDCGGDILDCGVSPKRLLALLRRRFLEAGGTLLEQASFKRAEVYDDGLVAHLLPSAVAAAGPELADVNRPTALQPQRGQEQPHAAAAASSNGRTGSDGNGAGAEQPQPQRRRQLTARLLVDCMGHFSPIVKQMRSEAGQQPDGMLLVVGGCFAGVPPEHNTTADLLATVSDAFDDSQLFWESFPAADSPDSRTVYMFQYTDAHPSRPSFAAQLDTLCALLPAYQGVPLQALRPRRVLFGGFPCYRDAPLAPAWDRVLQVGDAGAGQSPLSFGGFGSMVRHLPRLIDGVSESLSQERLSRGDLSWLAPYQPCLSAAWLLQRAMAPRPGQLARAPAGSSGAPSSSSSSSSSSNGAATSSGAPISSSSGGGGTSGGARAAGGWLPADHVNRLLRCNFSVLAWLGNWALRPFLKDTLCFGPLAATMLGMSLRDPVCILHTVLQLGPGPLAGWVRSFLALAAYTAAHAVLAALARLAPPLARRWRFRRLQDAVKWGAGLDYFAHPTPAAGGKAPTAGAAAEPGLQAAPVAP